MAHRPCSVILVTIVALSFAACAGVTERTSGPRADGPVGDAPPEPPRAEGEAPGATGQTGLPEERPGPAQLTARAVELSPTETVPIRSDGSWVASVIDLDANDRPDVCLVTVSREAFAEPPRLSDLSAPGRLSQSGTEAPEFFFEIYINRPSGLSLFETKRIGRFPVLESLETVELAPAARLPVAVSGRFQDQIGHKQIWVTAGRQGLGTFMLEETPVIDSVVLDLDRDGIRDVLKAQSAFEQGRGYETFLTWYRWNGHTFAPHATTNIVRNLNEFLGVLEEHLTARRYERFLERAGRTDGLPAAEPRLAELVASLFRPEPETDPLPFARLLAEHRIGGVAFPEFLENPFPSPGERTSITAPLRVDTADGRTFYYRTSIVMARNPFDERQFRLSSPE